MMNTASPKSISKSTRIYRKLHTWVAVPLFVSMFLMGATGLLLGWKKQTKLLPKTQQGESVQATEWVGLDSLLRAAQHHARTLRLSDEVDRIDVRPQKGVAKVVFTQHFTEIQLDCKTAEVRSVSTRSSDFIEKIHDGSLLDFWLDTSSEVFKLTYTTVVSLGLLLLSFSGFWLWYNPIRIRRIKKTD
jgi:hypothetical protein